METVASKFETLRQIDVSKFIEKKGQLNYLSWAYAVDLLLKHDPLATWQYSPPVTFGETMMVFCTVNAFGKTMTAQLPVMNHKNQAVKNPDSFAVNVAMQRCLAKAIALHGIGLGIYAGEDLPQEPKQTISGPKISFDRLSDEMKAEVRKVAEQITDVMVETQEHKADPEQALEIVGIFCDSYPDDEGIRPAIWFCVDSKSRAAIKKYQQSLKGQ